MDAVSFYVRGPVVYQAKGGPLKGGFSVAGHSSHLLYTCVLYPIASVLPMKSLCGIILLERNQPDCALRLGGVQAQVFLIISRMGSGVLVLRQRVNQSRSDNSLLIHFITKPMFRLGARSMIPARHA